MNKSSMHNSEPTCTAISELLDAYSTNEVSIQEQQQVEQHLSSCQHCQQRLAEIHWLRKMLLETEPVILDATPARPTSNLADAVIAHLQKNAVANSPASTAPTTPAILANKRRTVSQRWQYPLLLVAAAICIALTGSFLLDSILGYMQHQNRSASMQAPHEPSIAKNAFIPWTMPPKQDAISSRDGFFSLLQINVQKGQYGFLYVYRANKGSISPRFTVATYQTGNSNIVTNLPATAQVLGHVGPYEVGYIYAPATDRVQQHITLRAFKPGQTSAAWQLTPLIQTMPIPNIELTSAGFSVDSDTHPEIQWTEALNKQMVTLIKYTPTGASKARPAYLFFLGDEPHKLRTITKEEYLKIAGPTSFF